MNLDQHRITQISSIRKGALTLKKIEKQKKSNRDKELNKKFFTKIVHHKFFYYINTFCPYKQPTNRHNTRFLMLTLRATLANVRENKIDSR